MPLTSTMYSSITHYKSTIANITNQTNVVQILTNITFYFKKKKK